MKHILLLALALYGVGCATVRPERDFQSIADEVAGRGGYQVAWSGISAADSAAARAEASLLRDTLTADRAVQLALLRNPDLLATYENLGIARAQVVQAGLLRNPVFGAGAGFPLEGGAPDLAFSVAFDFLGVLYLPLRRAVATSAYESARLGVTESVLRVAAQTKAAYFGAVVAAARAQRTADVLAGAEASYEAARLLREAGNTSAYTFLQEKALYEELRLSLALAEVAAAEAREKLARLMGVGGVALAYMLPDRLPPLPGAAALETDEAERAAVEASLALATAQQDVITYGRRLGLATPETLLPDLEVGAEAEREDGEWKLGPEAEIALPLFDLGQARRAAARAELRQRQARVRAVALDVRRAARLMRARLLTARIATEQYAAVLVPLRAEIARQALFQYNAMQIGVFDLLRAREQEIRTTMRYYDAFADYWRAYTDYELLLQGGLPAMEASTPMLAPGSATPATEAGH